MRIRIFEFLVVVRIVMLATMVMLTTLGTCFELTAMSENDTESNHAQCQLCRILKTVKMMEKNANNW